MTFINEISDGYVGKKMEEFLNCLEEKLTNFDSIENNSISIQCVREVGGEYTKDFRQRKTNFFFNDMMDGVQSWIAKRRCVDPTNTFSIIFSVVEDLLNQELLCFGEYIDTYIEILELCSLLDSATLCNEFTSHKETLKYYLSSECKGILRVHRARFLGVVNAFHNKLWGAPFHSNPLARLWYLCFALIPISFQGICKKGPRDLPARFSPYYPTQIDVLRDEENSALYGGPKDQAEGLSNDEDTIQSDSSSNSEKNAHTPSSSRKRREIGHIYPSVYSPSEASTRKKNVTDSKRSTDPFSIKGIFRKWRKIIALIQDPSSFLAEHTVGEVLGLLDLVQGLLHLFKTHPSLSESFSSRPIGSIRSIITKRLKSNSAATEYKYSRLIRDQTKYFQHFLLNSRFKDDLESQAIESSTANENSRDGSSLTEELSINRTLALSHNFNYSYTLFKEYVYLDSFRREILHGINSMLREIFFKKSMSSDSSSVAIVDSLPYKLKSSINSISDSLYRLSKHMPSLPIKIPRPRAGTMPWFMVPGTWNPPVTFASLLDEFDCQEAIMARWKREGCNDKLDAEYEKNSHIRNSNQEDLEENFPANDKWKSVLRFFSPLCDQIDSQSQRHFTSSETKLQKRESNYLSQFVSFVENLNGSNQPQSPANLRVIGGDLSPPYFGREKEFWYLPQEGEPLDPKNVTVQEMLQEKWKHYQEKIKSDEDPVNQIEESEKVVRDGLFQWRCHRLLNLTNLQLYDYSNQDKELRIKIREASLQDLTQAVVQRAGSGSFKLSACV